MVRSTLLGVHVAGGMAGLLLAGPVLWAPKRPGWHPWLGRAYLVALLAMCVTALALFAREPARLAGLGGIALGTLTCGAVGFLTVVRKPRLPGGWLVWHVNAMGSSVISFVTAFVVTMADGHVLAWILPTLVGAPLIARRTAQLWRPGAGATVRATA